MNKVIIPMIFVLLLVPVGAFAQSEPVFTELQVTPDGIMMDMEDNIIEIPQGYEVLEDDDTVEITMTDGKIVFHKNSGTITIYDLDNTVKVKSDSFVVRGAELNSDTWNVLDVNNEIPQITLVEDNEGIYLIAVRENDEGVFTVETVVTKNDSKTTTYFHNLKYPNHKFAFTESLLLPDNVLKLNSQDIDLNQFAGQSFPREVLEQNMDLVLEVGDMGYHSGIGFDQLWQVNLHTQRDDGSFPISLDYANVGELHTPIGQAVSLDPIWVLTIDKGVNPAYWNENPQSTAFDSYGNFFVTDNGHQRIVKYSSNGAFLAELNGVSTESVKIDSSGNLLFGDHLDHKVYTYDTNFNLLHTLGSGNSSGTGNLDWSQPYPIRDLTGNLWIGDRNHHRVLKFNSADVFQFQLGITNSPSQMNHNQFYLPIGMEVDSANNVYVNDFIQFHVKKYNQGGSLNGYKFGTSNNPIVCPNGTLGGWQYAKEIAIDRTAGKLYVTDNTGSRVHVFNTSGSYAGEIGQGCSQGQGVSGMMNSPHGVTVYGGDVVVTNTPWNSVKEITVWDSVNYSYKSTLMTVLGNSGSGNGEFNTPEDTVSDSNDNIYVVDTYNQRIQKFDSSGNYVAQIGSHGTTNPNSYQFNNPRGIAIDSNDNIYVVDHNCRVMKYNSSLVFQQVIAGSSAGGSNGACVAGLSNYLYYPYSIEVDSNDVVYVGDFNNYKVVKYSSTGSYLGQFCGTGSISNPPTSGQCAPMDMAMDSNDNLYLSYYNSASLVQKWDTNTGLLVDTLWGSYGASGNTYDFVRPWGIGVDANDHLWVGDKQDTLREIHEFDSSGNWVSTIQGYAGITTPYHWADIKDISFNNAGYMYVADAGNHRVHKFAPLTPPSSPTNLTTTQTVANQITLNWTAPSSGSAPTSYEVYLNGALIDTIGNVTTYTDSITGAEIGAGLTYMVEAINGAGSATSNNSFITSWDLPDVVTGVQANSGQPISLSWVTPLSDDTVTNFNIYRDGALLTTLGNVNSYQDSNIISGQSYSYTISAISAVGEGSQSSAVSAVAGVPPSEPLNLSSIINNPNPSPLTISLDWDAPTNMGTAGSLTGYEIIRDGATIDTIGTTSLYTDTVPNAGTFVYTVKAISAHGTSIASNQSSITTPTVPDADSSVTLAINNPNPNPLDITVSFVAPSGDGGSTITGYNLSSSPDDITYTSVPTAQGVTADQTITVANAGTWYFKSEAINNVGVSTLGSAVSITTPSVPTSPLNASSVINDVETAPFNVVVTWETPSSNGGSDLTQYNVYRKQGSGAYSLIDNTTGLSINDTLPSLLSTNFNYKIHAVNNVGESTAYTDTTITTFDVPQAPVLTGTTGTTVLSWNTPTSDAIVTGYDIYRDSIFLTNVTTTSHTDFTTIVFGNSYDYKIVAVSSLGDSVDSNTVTTTPETEITGMVALGITGTGAVIDWDEPAYYQGQITSYNVYYSEITANVSTPTTLAGITTNTYSNFAPTLDYDTTYIFGVTITSPLGTSGMSNHVTVITLEDSSIVSADPTTGGSAWFDIDSVNTQSINVIEFQRETQNIGGTLTDTLQVSYPSWWDEMTCDVDYKFAQKTEQYIEGTDMTAQTMASNANKQVIGFNFQSVDNEVIEVECAPQQTTQDDGVSAKYVITQNSLGVLQSDGSYSVGLPTIPLVAQITAFTDGEYGTDGDLGALNIVGLFAILISMVGFNRLNPIVGVLLSASMIFILSWFGIITIPVTIVGAIALVIFLAWGATRNK